MRIILSVIALFFLAALANAAGEMPLGSFQIINSAGFVERNGARTPLESDVETAQVRLQRNDAGALILTISDTDIILYEIENGLGSLTWNAGNSSLLHHTDILDLSGYDSAENVPAWGANLDWPDLGDVQLVLLPLRKNAYVGFLISHPDNSTVVRQMEVRKIPGPPNRPAGTRASKTPAIN